MAEEPLAKRQRLAAVETAAAAATERAGPSITSLFQISAGLAKDPSPGAMHGCRIATCHSPISYASVIASGASVYWSQVRLQQPCRPEHGKEGILIPVRLQAPPVVQLSDIKHAGEVQGLALAGSVGQRLLLATVDAFGHGTISLLDVAEDSGRAAAVAGTDPGIAGAVTAAAAAASPVTVASQIKLKPQDGCREAGWAGICFSSSSPDSSSSSSSAANMRVATARCFAKDVTLYDAESGNVVRTYYTTLNPYALRFLPPGISGDGSSLIAVNEGHMISLWDARDGGSAGGCVQRMATASIGNPLYSLDWCTAQGGLLGTAGADRSVFLVEPRKWRTLTKWSGATRLAIHRLLFLDCDPTYAVLAGLDMEVLCGRWDKSGSNSRAFQAGIPDEDNQPIAAAPGPGSGGKTTEVTQTAKGAGHTAGGFSFRSASRWLGVSKTAGSDVLAGFAASGDLVYATVG